MGEASFSSISLDSMTFNFGVIALIALCGYGISQLVARFYPALMLPVFSCAFIAGLVLRRIFDRTHTAQYLSPKVIGHLCGAFTDYLVAFGVASIKLTVVAQYVVPLALYFGLCPLGRPPHPPDLLVREIHLHVGLVHRDDGHEHRPAAHRRSR